MGLARKYKRRLQKEGQKMLKKAAKQMSQRMEMIGDNCANCGAALDKSDISQLESWKVYQNDRGVHLICPDCQIEIEAMKRQIVEAESEEESVNV